MANLNDECQKYFYPRPVVVYLVWREDDVVAVFSERSKAMDFIVVERLDDVNDGYYYKIEEKEVQ